MPSEAKYVLDVIRDASAGMNAGIDPLLLQRNQLAFARNVTARGTFPTHRPAYVKIPIDFGGGLFQSALESGLFQGAQYYKPDFGTESIILSISGRLFKLDIVSNSATASEIGISGDNNSATAVQVWMWQAEKWMIINDSLNLPIFFDGNSSRRSVGESAQVATVNTNFTAPAQGITVNVTLNSTFSGPFDVPLRFTSPAGGPIGTFQAVGTGGSFTGYPVTLKNINDTAGSTQAANSSVVTANIVGTAAHEITISGLSSHPSLRIDLNGFPAPNFGQVLVQIDFSHSGDGSNVQLRSGTITESRLPIEGDPYYSIVVTFDVPIPAGAGGYIHINYPVLTSGSNSSLVAHLNASINAPAINSTVTALFDLPYTGSIPQNVFINNKQYQITAIGTPEPSNQVVFLNVNATQGDLFTGSATPASATSVDTISELPAGRMGAYGLGRVWEALTDGISYIGGDIVGGSSGLAAYNKRDAVLKVQENDRLAGGGNFRVPGQVGDIRAMIFTSVLDASLGQGPLAILTPNIVFTCNAPVDRTTWQNMVNPIQSEGLKGFGGTGQDSTLIANSDVMMRSLIGFASYIQGRRDFDVWGNVPISREVDPIIAADNSGLLQFASGADFDNRMLQTTGPVQCNFGVYWTKLVALNFDPVSSLRGKAPSIYDGVWDGLNILKLVKGSFAGVERLFAICVSEDLDKIELWEILKSADSEFQDEDDTQIVWEYESAALNFNEQDPRKRNYLRLIDGELRIDRLDKTLFGTPITERHTVYFETFFKADQAPEWTAWKSFSTTFDPNKDDPGYRYAFGLGEPTAESFDETNNLPLREGSSFQVKLRVTGHCRIIQWRLKAVEVSKIDFVAPVD